MSGLRCALSILAIGLVLTLLGMFEPAGELLMVAGAFGGAVALDPGTGREQPQQQRLTPERLTPAPPIGFSGGLPVPTEWSTHETVDAEVVNERVA